MILFTIHLLAQSVGPTVWDLDGDDLSGPDDHCPGHREDVNGWQDDDGCPDLDVDRDGLYDFLDPAPREPGSVSYLEEVPYRPIWFRADEQVILGDQHRVLDATARWLAMHPEVRMLVIEGYATPDEAGGAALARARAEAARDGLQAAGAPWDRLLIGACRVDGGEEAPELRRRVRFGLALYEGGPPPELDPWGLARPEDPWGAGAAPR